MGQYYAINGSFLLEPALGVQRYAAEILKQMNKMAPAYKECLRLVLVLPETPRIEEIRREFSNIEVRCAGKSRRVKVWEQVCFKKREGKGNLPVQYRAAVFKGRAGLCPRYCL